MQTLLSRRIRTVRDLRELLDGLPGDTPIGLRLVGMTENGEDLFSSPAAHGRVTKGNRHGSAVGGLRVTLAGEGAL